MNIISFMFKYLLLYIIIIFGSISISYFSNKRIDQTIPIYFLITFIFLYIFGILNILLIGLYLYLILNILIDIYVMFKILKNRDFEKIKEFVVTPASIVYTILFFTFAIFTKNAAFAIWDEFTFWSIATKNMFYSNSLYLNNSTTLIGVGYPPCPTIIEYFFCKILQNYSQGIELFAYQMFGFSLFLPFFKKSNLKNKLLNICISISILFIPAIFIDGYFYMTIYADSILGILMGYILYEYFTSDKDKFLMITLAFGLFTISATKATGIILAFISLLIIFFDNLLNDKYKKNKKFLVALFIILFAIILSYFSWKLYIGNYTTSSSISDSGQNSIMDMIQTIFATMFGTSTKVNITFQTFFKDFFDKPYYSIVPFGLTGSAWISIFVLVYVLIYKYMIDKKLSDRFKRISILIAIGTVIYIILIQVAYYLMFTENEAVIHNSMQRYIGTIFIVLLMFSVGISFTEYRKNLKNRVYLLIPIFLLPFTPMSIITNATVTSGINNIDNQAIISTTKEFADYVISNTEKDAKIYVVHQNYKSDSYHLQFRYFMTPKYVPMANTFKDDGKTNVDEFEKKLYNEYDYVVIINSDEYFNSNFGSLFFDDISDWTLYKIEKYNGKVKLYKK